MLRKSVYQEGARYREDVQKKLPMLKWTKYTSTNKSELIALISDTKDESVENIAHSLGLLGSAGNLFSNAGTRIQSPEWDSFLKGFVGLPFES